MATLPPLQEKRGAGLLLFCNNDVLLLLRNSRHNDLTWGLPGGNCDALDASLQETAAREAREELGTVPPLQLVRECLTMRGKRGEKHYTVFLCRVEPAVRAAWTPVLNEEHREHKWFSVDSVTKAVYGSSEGPPAPLHPVISALVVQFPGILQEVATAVKV